MLLIRNGYAVSTRRGFLGVLFPALLAFALFDPGAAIAQEVKQIKLTEKHIQGFMAAYEDMAKVYDGGNVPDIGDTREVWFIRGGFLYEVATYKELEPWLTEIMSTWKFL
jgi:hypothetical protein